MALPKSEGRRPRLAGRIGLVLGPLLLLVFPLINLQPSTPTVSAMAGVAALMAVWWITDAVPLAATALLPMVLFPAFGIMSGKQTAPVYVNSTIFLFIGGFMIALAMEQWQLHKRIALWIIRAIGGGPSRMVLGFLCASAFLSMWISNTATAIMMLPIGLAVIAQLEQECSGPGIKRFSISLMIAIAYGCSAGGIATLVGTPPNLSFRRIFEITFPQAPEIGFGQWILLGLPLTFCLLLLAWLLLVKVFYRPSPDLAIDRATLDREIGGLGPMAFEERVVLIVFGLTAMLWVFRSDLNLGLVQLPGWSRLLPFPDLIDDGSVALLMALSLFLIPSRKNWGGILRGDVFRRIPWDIVILFGGGFALAKGFQVTGLSDYIGEGFRGLKGVHPLVMILLVCMTITFMTELTSNTATTEMILPILASVAIAIDVNPLALMVPATLSASCAFMMPVATPPNAIVFGSGRIRVADMARVGLVMNLLAALLITGLFALLANLVFGIDFSAMPAWSGR